MPKKLPLTSKEFQNIYSKVTRLTVMLVISNEKGNVLMTLRNEHGWEGKWALPGVTVHYREKVVDAAKRVAREELGVDVDVREFLDYVEYPTETDERGYGYTVSLAFKATVKNGEPKPLDADKLDYFNLENLPESIVIEERDFLQKLVL